MSDDAPQAETRFTPRVIRPAAVDWVKFDAGLARDGSIDPVDKALYAALASFADQADRDTDPDPDGEDVPTRAVLAACIGRSLDTVDRSTKRLESIGLITVERRRDPANPKRHLPSVYILRDQEWWDERAAARAQARREAREARGGGRTDAARGGRMDAARGSRTGAAVPLPSKKDSSSSCVTSEPQVSDASAQEEEASCAKDETTLTTAEALVDAVVAKWDARHRRPTVAERRRLVVRVGQVLADGASPDGVVYTLTRDLDPSQVKTTAVQVVTSRTKGAGWVEDPPAAATTIKARRPQWCGECDEPTRLVFTDIGTAHCPRCHPACAG